MFFLLSVALSAAICFAILASKTWHTKYTAKVQNIFAKQSSHCTPTPRIGGIFLLAFFIVGLSIDEDLSYIVWLLLLSTGPVFLGGFGEDIGLSVSPKTRLTLSFLSAAISIFLFETWIFQSGVVFLDIFLSHAIVAIPFTLLISGGVCHSMNLVDGLNGLAIGLSIISTVSLALISFFVGDDTLLKLCLTLFGAQVGIFLFNFPFGKIFLGDAGAYTMGHLLTWISILLLTRNPEVAPFAVFLVFFWPVADMLFSIMRRIRNGKPIDQPDRMHFHQFAMRALELTFDITRSKSNPLAAATILPLASLPAAFAIIFYDANGIAIALWIICFGSFVWTYVAGIRLARYLARARKNNETLLATIKREGLTNIRIAVTGHRTTSH